MCLIILYLDLVINYNGGCMTAFPYNLLCDQAGSENDHSVVTTLETLEQGCFRNVNI